MSRLDALSPRDATYPYTTYGEWCRESKQICNKCKNINLTWLSNEYYLKNFKSVEFMSFVLYLSCWLSFREGIRSQ